MLDITWKKYEKDMKSGDVDTQRQATDAFIDEREKQTTSSKKARNWEEDRKKEIVKNKPLWVKQDREGKESLHNKAWNKLLKGGTFESNLIPAPGYVLVGIEEKEVKSDSGIIISNLEEEPNEGVVLEVGQSLVTGKFITPPPCKVKDNILFKRGAGLQLTIKEKACKLLYFPDILGVFR